MSSKIGIVIGREFSERVRKKSFIITTLLMPLLMIALMCAPALIMEFASGDSRTIAVIDRTGYIAQGLHDNAQTRFIVTPALPLDSALADPDAFSAVLFIPEGVDAGKEQPVLYTNGASSFELESDLATQINSAIEDHRLQSYNIDNLKQIMAEVESDVSIRSLRNEAGGEARESSAALSYILGMVLTFLLYMCLLLYGQMVMTSIIEEKTNRVLEIVVSSVSPTQLMLGKICGIGLVAVTQILIWGVLIAAGSAFLLPALLPGEVAAEAAALNAGTLDAATASVDIDMLQAVAMLGNVGYVAGIFGLLLLFLVGGFLLYAAIYAAIGSAVDNIQDAGQMQSFVIFPIIFGIIFGMMAAKDPASGVAFWTSIIPFTSPMVMMARVPSGLPWWEIVVSLVLLYATFLLMVWVAAKIYRVGIFMYGKKPTVRDLVRWVRYK